MKALLIRIASPLPLMSAFLLATARAQIPSLLNYQGRVAVGGVNFDGSGLFKFALVNADASQSFWSNDGTSAAGGEPAAAVPLTVTKGLYSVLLGDTSLTNMGAIPPGVFENAHVCLRVWFNDGPHGFQHLAPDQRISAVGYAMMAGIVPDGSITAAKIATSAVDGGKLAPGAAAANLDAGGQSPVAGGGIILSQESNATGLAAAGYVKLGETVTVDFWKQRASNDVIPFPQRREHTAVWTGSEMIVWGGLGSTGTPLKTGARYHPAINTWTAINFTDAPEARSGHTAVWTGTEMIVWGGRNAGGVYVNTGARYDPATDAWTPTQTSGAPAARPAHTAVWTGSEMIVWGGSTGGLNGDITGGRYEPAADAWQATSTASTPTVGNGGHTAVWTGSEMIVWGGQRPDGSLPSSGGRYDPLTDAWAATPAAPGGGRIGHTAIWTGVEMIVWGGRTNSLARSNTGARYTPGGSWTLTSTANAPVENVAHTAVWTGTEMIAWGGTIESPGGRYNPALSSPWTAMSAGNAPTTRTSHTAVWTGREMLIYGGYEGAGPTLSSNACFGYTPPRALFLYQRP